MNKQRFIRKPLPVKRMVPFASAEEAWFWYVRAERARREGAHLIDLYSAETRPCDPDDMYRFVMGLHRRRLIRDEHLSVLARFGWRECPPDARVREEERAVCLWDEALDRLTTVLKSKGIVHHEDQHSGPQL